MPHVSVSGPPGSSGYFVLKMEKNQFSDLIDRINKRLKMTRKEVTITIIIALLGLIGTFALAGATYLAPAHAEEKKFELAERARRIQQAEERAREQQTKQRSQEKKIARATLK